MYQSVLLYCKLKIQWFPFQAKCDFGSRANRLLESISDQIEKRKLQKCMVSAMASATDYLIKNLPINQQIVHDAQ